MINLREYRINNSVKAGKKLYIPYAYLVGLVLRHTGEKASSIFKVFTDLFKSNASHRKDFDSFIENTFNIDDKKRIISLKNERYAEITLFDDYPFKRSLANGFRIIKDLLGDIDLEDVNENTYRKIMGIRLEQVKAICERERIINCGINQGIFDFVVTRECLMNQQTNNEDEIASFYYEVLVSSELLCILIDNVKTENEEKCLRAIRTLSISKYDPYFELMSLDELKQMTIEDVLYYVGSNLNSLVNILNYYSEKGDDVFPQMFSNYIANLDKELFNILSRRERETLEEIGQSYGITRERVRQIENKGIESFNDFYLTNFCTDLKNLIFIFPNISSVFSLESLEAKLGNYYDCFKNLMKSIVYAGEAKYYSDLDAVVESEDVYNFFVRMANEVFGKYFKCDELDNKINDLLESVSDYGFSPSVIRSYVCSSYKKKGKVYAINGFKLTKADKAEIILQNHFDDGFHFSDLEQIKKFNEYSIEEFGDVLFTDEDIDYSHYHIVQAIIERTDVRLIDRGTYIHASKAVNMPIELVDKVLAYMNEKNRAVAYSNLFETFKNELTEIGINNKYALQGALSIYFGELFSGKRDYITPVEMQKTLRDSISEWISSRQELFTYEDFVSEFKGVAMSVFMTAIYEYGGSAYYWQRGYVNVKYLNISETVKTKLKQLIDLLIGKYHMEYCSADEIFTLVDIQMHDFIVSSRIKYSYDLFSIIQILFADEYKFKRPLIGTHDAVFENTMAIIDGYLSSKSTVKFDKMRKFVDLKVGSTLDKYVTNFDIIKSKWNEFVAVDSNTMIRKETIEITEREIIRLDVIIDMVLEQKDKVFVKEDLIERFYFVTIAKMKVNPYLLMGVVNTFLHDKYEISMESTMFKHGMFSIKKK